MARAGLVLGLFQGGDGRLQVAGHGERKTEIVEDDGVVGRKREGGGVKAARFGVGALIIVDDAEQGHDFPIIGRERLGLVEIAERHGHLVRGQIGLGEFDQDIRAGFLAARGLFEQRGGLARIARESHGARELQRNAPVPRRAFEESPVMRRRGAEISARFGIGRRRHERVGNQALRQQRFLLFQPQGGAGREKQRDAGQEQPDRNRRKGHRQGFHGTTLRGSSELGHIRKFVHNLKALGRLPFLWRCRKIEIGRLNKDIARFRSLRAAPAQAKPG